MTDQPRAPRLAYDDPATPEEMCADCRAVGKNLHLERAARTIARPAPSLYFEDYPRELPKRDIEISVAAARLAGALNLQLDGD